MKLGSKMSAESRAKMSAARRGELNPNWGRPLSDEQRAKISAARTGQSVSAETRAKVSAAVRRRYEDPAEREKQSAAGMGHPVSAETRAKIGAAQLGDRNRNWKGDDAGYVAHHLRHRKVLPRVCAHADDSCNGPLQAAFNHDTPPEFVKVDPGSGLLYSQRPEDYLRLCQSHHKRYDKRNQTTLSINR